MALTESQCIHNKDIPTEVIEQDILDTQAEIDQYKKELSALMGDRQKNKLPIYMAEGNISKRESFIDNLNSILTYRKNKKE